MLSERWTWKALQKVRVRPGARSTESPRLHRTLFFLDFFKDL
jgi:hypothetical protein